MKRKTPDELETIQHVHAVFTDEIARQQFGRVDFPTKKMRDDVNNATIRRVGLDHWNLFMNDWFAIHRIQKSRAANRARAKASQTIQA